MQISGRVIACVAAALVLAAVARSLADDPAQKRASSARPLPKITISKETTYITEPLRADGYPDYVAAVNQHCSKGVTPENNAAIPFWQAVGPKGIDKKIRKQYFEMLGIAELPDEGAYFVEFSAFVDGYHGRKQADWGTPDDEKRMEDADRQYSQAQRRPWSEEEFPMIAAVVKRNEGPLRVFVAGTRRPRYYSPLIPSESRSLMSTIGQSGMTESREVIRCLGARAMKRLHEGNVADAWDDVLACRRWASLASQGPYLIDHLLATTWAQSVFPAAVAVAHHGTLTAEQASGFADDLRTLPPAVPIQETFRFGERLFGLDCTLQLAVHGTKPFQADLDLGLPTTFLELLGLDELQEKALGQLADDPRLDWSESLRYLNSWYDRIVKAHHKPSQTERAKLLTAIDDELAALSKQAAVPPAEDTKGDDGNTPKALARRLVCLANSGGSAIGKTGLNVENNRRTHEDLSLLALALAAYHSDHKVYPRQLADLCPKYMAELPKDPFTDEDLKYRLEKSGYVLYSVGGNEKNDGGRSFMDDVNWFHNDSATEEERARDDIAIRTPPKESKK